MSSGAEAADQVVSMSLRGIEVMAKISGEGAKHLAVYLFAALQGQKRTKGSIRLESLLRSGKELKVFAVKNEDLSTFCKVFPKLAEREPSLPKRSERQAESTKAAQVKTSRTKTNKPKSARKRGKAK